MKKYVAEAIGTFALVFCGTGAIIIDEQTQGGVTHAGIAITFGLIVMVMIFALGNISGAHLNPAVSLAFVVAGRFSFKQLLPYIIAQLAGAVTASLILKILFPLNDTLGATLPFGSPMQSFIIETILTFFLVLVILTVATGSREQGIIAGLAIGATVLLEAMFAGPITGASMNPARSIAPALISGHTESLWVYIAGTFAGGLAAVPVARFLQNPSSNIPER